MPLSKKIYKWVPAHLMLGGGGEPSDGLAFPPIGNCRNVRGLGKSMVVFRLFEKLRYSNETTKFENIYQE